MTSSVDGTKMRAIGLLAGVGTLLREAQEAGFDVVGNVDVRSYFRTAPWVWESNFDSPFISDLNGLENAPDDWYEADLALGHPPCGRQSSLGFGGVPRELSDEERQRRHDRRASDQGLLPLFTALVRKFRPRVFALDNLPKILKKAAPKEWWESELPDYRLTFLTIVNWDYGCCQKRPRLWVIGTRSKKAFSFRPTKTRINGPKTALEAFGDLPWEPWIDVPELAHVHRSPEARPIGGFWCQNLEGERYFIKHLTELASGFISIPSGMNWPYISQKGRPTHKMGRVRVHPDRPAATVTGGGGGGDNLLHPLTGWPLTPRERARLMGWPDDFVLWNSSEPFDDTVHRKLVQITGKAVPSEFPRYLIPQLRRHLRRW